MYQGKRKIMNPERHEEYRSQAVSYRGGAIFNAFIDLEDIINKSVFAKTYMNHSQSWFSQKLNECPVGGAKKSFSASEAETIAESFRDLAKKIKELVDSSSLYADWMNNDRIKGELESKVARLLYKEGYPPTWDEEVFERVLDQVENYKKFN